tara:strand:- start:837 stop:1034 length:198 start_codon:yes stop_codon:yes gene_type:complete
MTQERSYKQYQKVSKEEASAPVLEQGYSIPKVAKSLILAANMLSRWKELHEQQIQVKVLVEDERE